MKILSEIRKKLTSFYNKVSGQFKKMQVDSSSINEKNIITIEKCCKFEDNFDYSEIIEKYYNGDKRTFMEEKDEYGLKINRLKELIKDTKSRIVGYSELIEIRELIIELGGMTQDEYDKLLRKYEYDFDTLYENIIDERQKSKINQIKTSEIIGTLSGTTMNIQYKFLKNYDEFIKGVKK